MRVKDKYEYSIRISNVGRYLYGWRVSSARFFRALGIFETLYCVIAKREMSDFFTSI